MDAPWRVRIRNADASAVLGAGILVCGGHVLTCAHVISSDTGETPPTTRVVVEFAGLRGTAQACASVSARCWFPPYDDVWGDVALLELDHDRREGLPEAPLRRHLVTGSHVRAYGYPAGAEVPGVWAQAVVAGCGAGEWVQIDSLCPDNRVSRGFSGAGVVDRTTDAVIGMVISEYTERGVSWMLPVGSILRYLPGLKSCINGDPLVPSEWSALPGLPIDVDFARQITSWLQGRRRVRVLVTGDSTSARSAALRHVITFTDRESRPSAGDRSITEAAAGTVPPVGSVDLVLDGSGRTVEEVSRSIADRLGIPIADPMEITKQAPPMTLVIDGVDDVAEPAALLNEVLAPLAERGVRLLLGFHRESSQALHIARSQWPESDQPDDHPEVIRQRLDALTNHINDVADREDALGSYREHVAARVADPPELPARAVSLRLRLCALRKADAVWQLSQLGACEAAVERALRRLDGYQRSLEWLLDRRRELTGRLRAFHAMAADQGLVEDTELDTVYRQAYETLRRGPADLMAAGRLVDSYHRAVRCKIDGMRR